MKVELKEVKLGKRPRATLYISNGVFGVAFTLELRGRRLRLIYVGDRRYARRAAELLAELGIPVEPRKMYDSYGISLSEAEISKSEELRRACQAFLAELRRRGALIPRTAPMKNN